MLMGSPPMKAHFDHFYERNLFKVALARLKEPTHQIQVFPK